jgi:monoterpene epsilon-lactone hydrolase
MEECSMSKQQRQTLDATLRRSSQDVGPQTVEQMRTGFAELMAAMPVPTGVRSTATIVGEVPGVLVEPEPAREFESEPALELESESRPEPALDARPGTILYFHGGSFVLGSPQTAMSLTANLVVRTGIRSISLDYRLAPEHPFPAAIKDGVAAYRALLDSGIEASSIAFAGDSAGGGLSVTICLMARAAGLPMPAAVVTFSAWLDILRSGASMDTKDGIDPFFTKQSLGPTSDMYLAGQDPNQDLLSPATLADLTGLPPLLLQVGTNEVLLDDSTRLVDRARAAGVDVILDVTADVPHVFQTFVGQLDEADQALDRAALFLRQHLARA